MPNRAYNRYMMYHLRQVQKPIPSLILLLCSILVMGSGCGSSSSDTLSAPGLLQKDAVPKALRKARLLFDGPDGIYLAHPGTRPAQRMVATGQYPRWLSDGQRFVFIRDNQIVLRDIDSEEERVLAQGRQLKAVATDHSSDEVYFIDGSALRRISVDTGQLEDVLVGKDFREIAVRGDTIIATLHVPLRGFGVYRFTLSDGTERRLGRGCSSGLSPDGRYATINQDGHRELVVVDAQSGDRVNTLIAPAPHRLDNQFWSNHADWITAVSEDHHIILHRTTDSAAWQITTDIKGDRPDLYIP